MTLVYYWKIYCIYVLINTSAFKWISQTVWPIRDELLMPNILVLTPQGNVCRSVGLMEIGWAAGWSVIFDKMIFYHMMLHLDVK